MKFQNNKTEILVTTGPTMNSIDDITKVSTVGATNFRLHLGNRHRDNINYFYNIRKVENDLGIPLQVMLDFPTSRPRLGDKTENKLFSKGEIVSFIPYYSFNNKENEYVLTDFDKVINSVDIGNRILFRDGKVTFIVISIDKDIIKAKCINAVKDIIAGGSCSLPDTNIEIVSLCKEDIEIAEQMAKIDLVPDWVALSFASNRNQVLEFSKFINKNWNKKINIIAKIENYEGLSNVDEIIEVVDGIMVARGDLALHTNPEKIPYYQDILVKKSRNNKKLSIIATQMFEYFAINGVINRAELSDIALAVRQNADVIMLSMESCNSNYPIESVEMVKKIVDFEIQVRNYDINDIV